MVSLYLTMYFFERMLRKTNARLDNIAPLKPEMLKLTCFELHKIASPRGIGRQKESSVADVRRYERGSSPPAIRRRASSGANRTVAFVFPKSAYGYRTSFIAAKLHPSTIGMSESQMYTE